MSLVDKIRIKKFLQNPPTGFNIVVIQGDIGIVQIYQITHSFGHLSPLVGISEYGLTAFLIKFFDAVFLDILLSVHSKLLFNFDFNRKSMGVPSGFSVNLIAFHGPVAAYGILESSGHYVVNSRHSVGCGRSLIENIAWITFSGFHAFLQKVFFLPLFHLLILDLCNRSFR